MILRPAPSAYDRDDQAAARDAIRRADDQNVKRGHDVQFIDNRLILSSPDGARWVLGVSNTGATTWTVLPS